MPDSLGLLRGKRGETEWAVNIGDKPYRELLIELKDPRAT